MTGIRAGGGAGSTSDPLSLGQLNVGTLNVSGNATLSGTANVIGGTTFVGNVIFSGTTNLLVGTSGISDPLTINRINVGTLNVSGAATFSGTITAVSADISGLVTASDLRVSGQVSADTRVQTPEISMSGAQGTSAFIFKQYASGRRSTISMIPGVGSGASPISDLTMYTSSLLNAYTEIQAATNFTSYTSTRSNASGQVLPGFIWQLADVPNVTTLQPLQISRSGNFILNQSGGTMLLSNGMSVSGISNLAGTTIVSGTANLAQFTGMNWVGTLAATAGSGAVAGFTANNAEGFLTVQVSGVARKIPYYNS